MFVGLFTNFERFACLLRSGGFFKPPSSQKKRNVQKQKEEKKNVFTVRRIKLRSKTRGSLHDHCGVPTAIHLDVPSACRMKLAVFHALLLDFGVTHIFNTRVGSDYSRPTLVTSFSIRHCHQRGTVGDVSPQCVNSSLYHRLVDSTARKYR